MYRAQIFYLILGYVQGIAIFQVHDPPSLDLVEDKMKQNSLQLMQKFHKTREVFEEIAHY